MAFGNFSRIGATQGLDEQLISVIDRARQASSETSVTITEIGYWTNRTRKYSNRAQRYPTSFEIDKYRVVTFVLKINRLVVVRIKNSYQIFELNESFCFTFDYNQSAIFLSELNTDQIEDNKTPISDLFFQKNLMNIWQITL